MNLALAIQQPQKRSCASAETLKKHSPGADYLVMAGGVALNCVATAIDPAGPFKDIWIQPRRGRRWRRPGAALAAWHIWQGQERQLPYPRMDNMAAPTGAGIRG